MTALAKHAGGVRPDRRGDSFRIFGLFGCTQHQGLFRAEQIDFPRQVCERADAENHAGLRRGVDELPHRGYHGGICASTLTQTDFTWVYSCIASKPISRP